MIRIEERVTWIGMGLLLLLNKISIFIQIIKIILIKDYQVNRGLPMKMFIRQSGLRMKKRLEKKL